MVFDDVDFSEEHAWGNGFDRDVCEGCRYKGTVLEGAFDGCTICGCPFVSLSRVKGGSPPQKCPRLAEHARQG